MYMRSREENIYQAVIHLIVGFIMLSAVFPLVYVIGMSLTSQPELLRRNFFVIIPQEPTLEAYRRILSTSAVWQALLVSVVRSGLGTLLTLTCTLLGGFVLARKSLPGRNVLLLMVLASILFNGGLIPTYLVVRQLQLTNTIWSLILPGLVDSFGLLVIKIFIENLPDEVTDAARIDGVSEIQLLTRIVLPLTAPALAAIGMFAFVNHWNSWFDALIYLSDKDQYPLQLVLRNMLVSASGVSDTMSSTLLDSQRVSSESIKMATVVIATLPIVCLYPFVQKHFTKGVYLGAIKG